MKLPQLLGDPNTITISGHSAGANLAHKMHLKYPEIKGLGLFAGETELTGRGIENLKSSPVFLTIHSEHSSSLIDFYQNVGANLEIKRYPIESEEFQPLNNYNAIGEMFSHVL